MKKRAMSSSHASYVKREGHQREHVFAELIGGEVNAGAQTDKKDVIDSKHQVYSVKGGTWWQIFLYSKGRFETNTIFRTIGRIADLMVKCIDVFPDDRSMYLRDKERYKSAIQEPMRQLAQEFDDPRVKQSFLDKALFNAGEVNFLAVQPPRRDIFYVFHQEDVVDVLSRELKVGNSKARNPQQRDCQKVVFRTSVNVGEIEIRTDSKQHYKQAKCRFNAELISGLLLDHVETKTRGVQESINKKVIPRGKAVKMMP